MRRPGRILAALVLALVLVPLASCARSEPPPGTRPDNTPPRTEELRPDFRAEVPGFDGFARVQFDEPVSNPRNLGRDIVGSPAGQYEVKPGRSSLEVRPEDGWQDSVVYYIRLPSGVSDLLRNRATEAVEWLFSTGGAVPETQVNGRVIDRVTARGERGLRVLFLGADSVPYTAVSDTGGTFRLPGLPPGAYEAAGFQDQNRNFTYDPEFEPGGTAEFSLDEEASSAELRIIVLPADTTPPVLAAAAATDSVTLRLEFDDPLDPEAELEAVTLAVRDTLTGERREIEEFVVGSLPPPEIEEPVEPEEAEVEEVEDEEVAEDEAPEEVAAPEEALEPEEPDPIGLDPAPVFLTVRLAEPLTVGVYEVEIDGVANLRALRGGGSVTFEYEPPPEPEPEPEGEGEGEDEDGRAVRGAPNLEGALPANPEPDPEPEPEPEPEP